MHILWLLVKKWRDCPCDVPLFARVSVFFPFKIRQGMGYDGLKPDYYRLFFNEDLQVSFLTMQIQNDLEAFM